MVNTEWMEDRVCGFIPRPCDSLFQLVILVTSPPVLVPLVPAYPFACHTECQVAYQRLPRLSPDQTYTVEHARSIDAANSSSPPFLSGLRF